MKRVCRFKLEPEEEGGSVTGLSPGIFIAPGIVLGL